MDPVTSLAPPWQGIAPAARRLEGSILDPAYLPAPPEGGDPVDVPSRAFLRGQQRVAAQQELINVLGPYYMNTNYFMKQGGGMFDALVFNGEKLTFSLWAPHRHLLVDIFPAAMPSADEMAARNAFAEANGLRYCVTPPGYVLSIDDLKEAVAQASGGTHVSRAN